MLAVELDKANSEIQRLKKLLKRPSDGSDISNLSTGSSQMTQQPKSTAFVANGIGKTNGISSNRRSLMFFGEEQQQHQPTSSPPIYNKKHSSPPMNSSAMMVRSAAPDFHVFSANHQ
jgi:hypothetical protein